MANTYEFISSVILSSSASTISFTSIPQTYDDLILKVSAKTNLNGDGDSVRLTINGVDSYPNWSTPAQRVFGYGTGVAAGANNTSSFYVTGSGTARTNIFGNGEYYFPNYSKTILYKAVAMDSVSEANATAALQMSGANVNNSTSAITSISIGSFDSGGSAFVQYTTAYLYGIKYT